MTAPMTRAKALSHPLDKPISPTLLQKHRDVHFCLCRNLVLSPQGFLWTMDEAVACFFGARTVARDDVPDIELAEKECHPKAGEGDTGGEDRWPQRPSLFTLNVPPMFSALTLAVNYYLSPKVPFPGMGNTSGITSPGASSQILDIRPGQSPSSSHPSMMAYTETQRPRICGAILRRATWVCVRKCTPWFAVLSVCL